MKSLVISVLILATSLGMLTLSCQRDSSGHENYSHPFLAPGDVLAKVGPITQGSGAIRHP